MFRAVRISLLLFILFVIAVSTWLTQARSTDWNNSLWIKIYPINGDGSQQSASYIEELEVSDFAGIEAFLEREIERYRPGIVRPVRVELGDIVVEQPPTLPATPQVLNTMLWSLKMRFWANSVAGKQDDIEPDVRIFVRYHRPDHSVTLENSVGLQKGMVGVVNGFASRQQRGRNNVIIAHEFLHTLGATDKYSPGDGQPISPDGLAEPDREPLYPQRFAEIMGGRIAVAADHSVIPEDLSYAVIGALSAREIRLVD
jgi:hypothetical protein